MKQPTLTRDELQPTLWTLTDTELSSEHDPNVERILAELDARPGILDRLEVHSRHLEELGVPTPEPAHPWALRLLEDGDA